MYITYCVCMLLIPNHSYVILIIRYLFRKDAVFHMIDLRIYLFLNTYSIQIAHSTMCQRAASHHILTHEFQQNKSTVTITSQVYPIEKLNKITLVSDDDQCRQMIRFV